MSVIVVFIAVFPLNLRNRLSVRAVVAKSLPRSQVGVQRPLKTVLAGSITRPGSYGAGMRLSSPLLRLFSSSEIFSCGVMDEFQSVEQLRWLQSLWNVTF